MTSDYFMKYIKIVTEVVKLTSNYEVCTKLLKVVMVTSTIQNVLLATGETKEDCEIYKCVRLVESLGYKFINKNIITIMFESRNKIAHNNDLLKMIQIFEEVDMQDIDNEFNTVIEIVEYFSPFNAFKIGTSLDLRDYEDSLKLKDYGSISLEDSDIPEIF